MEKMEVNPSETELRVLNATAESLTIADAADNDVEIDEPIIYDYMKYPNMKNKFTGKGFNIKRRVHFRSVVEVVTHTSTGDRNIKEIALRTEEEQSKNTMKRRNI